MSHILGELVYNIFIAGDLKGKVSDSSYIERIKRDGDVVLKGENEMTFIGGSARYLRKILIETKKDENRN
jgi:hypothetical protein